ncbi:MAG: nucleotide-binding protein [Methanolinea sp.]|nr:nucleotide-binding protein [Methanolinea sp.]
MKIGEVNAKVSILALVVVGIFSILLIYTYLVTGDQVYLVWGIPTVILLLVIPLALNYMSQSEYANLEPMYRDKARPVRIKMINPHMLGEIVRIEGVVERVYFQFINRPQYLVADRSGEISVKMFTTPRYRVKKGDVVEVFGQVMKRYVVTGDPVVNAVSISPVEKTVSTRREKKDSGS